MSGNSPKFLSEKDEFIHGYLLKNSISYDDLVKNSQIEWGKREDKVQYFP